MSVPLPWLIIFFGRFFGKKKKPPAPQAQTFRRRLFRLPRSLSITTEGKWFIAVLFLIGIAAINTGNNLLYLVLATLLSLIIVSGIMSESTLRGVKVRRTLPSQVYRDMPLIVRLNIENRKRLFPSFSFLVKELPSPGLKADAAYVVKLGPSGKAVKTARYTFGKRGRQTLPGLKVTTRFPFSLFLKGKEELTEDSVLVFPSIKPMKDISILARHGGDERPYAGKGDGSQLYGLRDYTLEDDSRFIHWKSAARNSRLLVKEFEREREKKVVIVFDNYSAADDAAFEKAVDEAASMASHYMDRGCSVGLKTFSDDIMPRAGYGQLQTILRALALIEPAGSQGAIRVTAVGS
ncbi:MAG: DUF58 domain-containing protein [Deltaproteobacteria bacterium]|nr:DUF58 domain-containing protein [Deltaproteobacteria bacterium]